LPPIAAPTFDIHHLSFIIKHSVETVTPEDNSASGIQAGKQSQRYTYNIMERLSKIEDGQGNEIARYSYDPFGRRIRKTTNQTGTVSYFYSPDGGVCQESCPLF
jgi:YD repeat-containing protein